MNPGRNGLRPALLTIGLLALASLHAGQARADTIYDAVGDFSLAANPNGAWSYGSLSSLSGGTFAAFTTTLSNQDYAGQAAWYNGQPVPNAMVVDKNTSGTTKNYFTIVHPTNLLRLDGESGIADVRWVAPTAGVYNVSGLFQRIDTGNVSVSVRVNLDGVTIFAADNFGAFNDQRAFQLSNLALAAGAVLDFAEGAAQYNNDSTGLSATITTAAVPEPSSLALCLVAALGLAGKVGVARPRRGQLASPAGGR